MLNDDPRRQRRRAALQELQQLSACNIFVARQLEEEPDGVAPSRDGASVDREGLYSLDLWRCENKLLQPTVVRTNPVFCTAKLCLLTASGYQQPACTEEQKEDGR